ncbi:MAG: hypothetical protein HYR71_11420, partial [Chloroflexi bacterium]|nr:hypothetical protein [Chloroflexota bacterium]
IEGLRLTFSVEAEPRGTAGALRAAEPWWGEQNLVLNGDTEIAFDLAGFYAHHRNWEADVTVGLAVVDDAARFGRASVAGDGRLLAFSEKDDRHTGGLVNAGVYLCSRRALSLIPATGYASIERDWLPLLLERGLAVYAIEVATHFTDIGTPEDYWRLANQG